jgi:nucleotide-binding universal stress UspA family protein
MNDQYAGRPVVAGVDGSESALDAVRWAAREAARRRAPLRLVAAVGRLATVHQYGDPVGGPDEQQMLLRLSRAHLAAAEQAAVEAVPGMLPEQEVLDGFPIPRLIEDSRTAQLLVIGNRGLGGVSGLLLGSVAFALGAHSACPVVVVRGRSDASDGPVVVGIDGSSLNEAALSFAFEAAAARHAPLIATHVWWDQFFDPATLPEPDWDAIVRREERGLAERLAGWQEKYPDVDVEPRVARDVPARALIDLSRRAQLVVVGSRGRGGGIRSLLGSVSHAVVHRADCPVAIVRSDNASGA